jgi:hypothetical protein
VSLTLHKDHAIVHTATIDVKVLRIDRRQLTLSVFRQLDEQLIFLGDGTLNGTPWGRVNYTWKENRENTAFHVIYQVGDVLKRSPVPEFSPTNLCTAAEWVSDAEEWDLLGKGRDILQCEKEAQVCRDAIASLERWIAAGCQRYSYPEVRPGFGVGDAVARWESSKFGTEESYVFRFRPSDEKHAREMIAKAKADGREFVERQKDARAVAEIVLPGLSDRIGEMRGLDQLFIAG